MLRSLVIENYALIAGLTLEPAPGLTTITGETGAGKSIMLGAMQLLLGQRADSKVLLDQSKKCIVEAEFQITKPEILQILDEAGLDALEQTHIRREIAPGGKSRAFINDSPVTLDILKAVMLRLVDVHSQHETLSLGQEDEQIQLLDTLAGKPELIKDYLSHYHEYQSLVKKKEELINRQQKETKEVDFNRFLLDELQALPLDKMDQQLMEEELKVQENIGLVIGKTAEAIDALGEGEINAQIGLVAAIQALQSIRKLNPELDELQDRLQTLLSDLRDIQKELNRKAGQLEADPERALTLQQSLNELYRLQKKHQAADLNALISIRENLAKTVFETDHLGELIKQTENELQRASQSMNNAGKALSQSRKKAADGFCEAMKPLLALLGIPYGQLTVTFQEGKPGPEGMDQVAFLFSANKGFKPGPLRQVASGGEFSRLMLAVKQLLAKSTELPTLIFDEIDAGISGEVAVQVAEVIKNMATRHQVICITHLPLMAAAGEKHYFVYKDHREEQSVSAIKALDQPERLQEIAKMIGGANPSAAALQSAAEMLQSRLH